MRRPHVVPRILVREGKGGGLYIRLRHSTTKWSLTGPRIKRSVMSEASTEQGSYIGDREMVRSQLPLKHEFGMVQRDGVEFIEHGDANG